MNKKILNILTLIVLVIFSISPSARATLLWESNIGSAISNFTDDDYRAISLGFNVNFYGVSYSIVYVNSNGNVSFGDYNVDPFNVSFPVSEFIDSTGWNAPGDERTMTAPLWDDLDPDPNDTGRSTSGVYTNIIGNPGSREFVVTWNDVANVSLLGSYYGSNTFQIILYEATNSIQFNYQTLSGITSPLHVSPKDVNGITIGVNAGDLPTDSIIRGTQYLYGFAPYSPPLPENDSLLFTYNPNFYGAGLGGYTVGLLTTTTISTTTTSTTTTTTTTIANCYGDVSGNGTISAFDAALIAQSSVNLITVFPVGTPVCTP